MRALLGTAGGLLLGAVLVAAVLAAPVARDALQDRGVRLPARGEVAAAPPRMSSDAPLCRTASGARFGCVRWRTPATTTPTIGPVRIAAGAAIVVDADGSELRSISIGTGAEQWRHRLPPRSGLRVLEPIADAIPVVQGGALRALEVSSGRLRWMVGDDASSTPPLDVVVAGPWILTSDGEQIAARAASDGDPVWTLPLGDGQDALLTGHGAFVRDRRARELVSIHQNVALPRWRAEMPQIRQVAAVTGDLVLLSSLGDLVAVDRVTGERRWDLRLRASAVVEAGEMLLITSPAPVTQVRTRAVDSGDGSLRWSVRYGGTIGDGPAVLDGLLVFFHGYGQPMVTAVDPATGDPRWSVEIPAPADDAVQRGDEIVVLTREGPVGLDQETGAMRWRLDTGPVRAVRGMPLLLATGAHLLLVEPDPPSRLIDLGGTGEDDRRVACASGRARRGGVVFPKCN